ncbi:MAG: hypothetical protein V5A43_05125 [Haloarculaceae archaeon]
MAQPAGAGTHGNPTEFDDLSEVSKVLLLAPSLGRQGSDACLDLLAARSTPANALAVTFTRSPSDGVAHWTDGVETAPDRGGIVAVGQEGIVDDSTWAVRAVESPSDLTGIGIQLNEFLSRMASASTDGESIAVCFNSITALLQYADLQRTFRFLHVVTGRVDSGGAVAHYHLDPDALDDQTVATIKGFFDAAVTFEADGSWSVEG